MPVLVLGVDAPAALRRRWRDWLAPAVQPFFVASLRGWPSGVDEGPPSAELRDTYKGWRISRSLRVLWLDEATFLALPRSRRSMLVRSQVACGRGAVPTVRAWSDVLDPAVLRAQADGHRFVWWPSLLRRVGDEVVVRFVSSVDVLPSRHAEVARTTWDACAELLPGAERIVGTFPPGSGPNCFGTVMAAAGVRGAENEWMQIAPFERWLASSCRRGGGRNDDDVGTVLVWRDRERRPVHAAVTLGGGWALEKPSQAWCTARSVLPVGDLIRANRSPGQRLERHHLPRP